ncbi:hypothetical protein C8Q77DRAFT_1219795 [Trametes polyzona]|nr:hypothetical protein C8Q77DRAFT_1219795 [Trametes polyzona]
MEEQINLYLSRCAELFDDREWGKYYSIADLHTIQGVLNFMRCMLTDIHEGNILVDYFCYHRVDRDDRQQAICKHSRSRPMTYGLFDFNLSLQLPPETPLKNCWRPASEAMLGDLMYHSDNMRQGEPFYNPFAYNVGCLEFLFIYYFMNTIPTIPMLAPLFGKMTTHIISDQFSAAETLKFFHRIEADVTPEILQSIVTLEQDYMTMNDPSLYWSCTMPEFQSVWRSHRPPPLMLCICLLRWLGSTAIGYKLISSVRCVLSI